MTRTSTIFALITLATAPYTALRAGPPSDAPLPPNASVDTILDALDQRGKPPAQFVAQLSDTTVGDSGLGNDSTRTGMIWFSRLTPTQLRVHVLFDKRIVGHVIQNEKVEYLLDGEWLTDRTET
jgi:hypothetical protein